MPRLIGAPRRDGQDDLAPPLDRASREQRWGDMMRRIDDSFTMTIQQDTHLMNPIQLIRPSAVANECQSDGYFSVRLAPGVRSHSSHLTLPSCVSSMRKLSEWIKHQKLNGTGEASEVKQYFERCVSILHSLVLKMIVTNMNDGKAEMEIAVDPKLITPENLVVKNSIQEGELICFIQTEGNPNLDFSTLKYDAMKALATVAYKLFMRGSGPPLRSFLPSTTTNSEDKVELMLSIHDSQNDISGAAKRQRAQDKNQCRIAAAMLNQGVPYPLCRFVVDLLGGECSDGLLFRSDNSFDSFSDVLADLKQMTENGEAFIHLSVKDQWRLAFGEKMHGREREMKKLLDVAARVSGATANDPLSEALALVWDKQQAVFVTGKAGSGKSRLVAETRRSLENEGWLFLSCKFETIVVSEPLGIISGAFDEFLKQCIGSSRQQNISSHLNNLMQPGDISILAKHVPCLIHYAASSIAPTENFQINKEHIHRLFGQLIEVLSAAGSVALFCDDLQWANAASISLFQALTEANGPIFLSRDVCSKRKSKILFIGSYRDNEVKDNTYLVQMLDRLKISKSVDVTEISVDGFDSDTLNTIISESLCLPSRRTKLVTEIVLQKTDGIVIHIIEFIGRLITEKILSHSLIRGWEFDSDAIENCSISEDVAELFAFKLQSLADDELLGLQICSLFGSQTDSRIINFIHDYDGGNSVDINAGLKAAMHIGLVDSIGSPDVFKFAHDIIVQAAFDSILDDKRSLLLKKLVTALIKNATAANEIDSVVFVTVDLINRIKNREVSETERVLYATMNEKAGKQALAVPDFDSAVKYTESAQNFLSPRHWETHRKLMLSIHETSALALYSCKNCNQDLFKEHANAVFQHASSLEEEFMTRYAWIRFISTSSLQGAIDECHSLLEHLGEPLDTSDITFSSACSELVRVKESFLSEIEIPQFLASARLEDPSKSKAMKIMSSLTGYYYSQRNYRYSLICAKMVEMSMKHGCSEDSVLAFAFFASAVVTVIGDIDMGCSLARMALSLELQLRHSIYELLPQVYAIIYGFALCWKEPLQATMEPILRGCRMGFDYGNIECAVVNAKIYALRTVHCAKNIDVFLSEVGVLASKASQHGQIPFIQYVLQPIYNFLCGLKGLNEQALAPLDVFHDNDELLDLTTTQGEFENQILLGLMYSIIFRDMDKAQHMVDLTNGVVRKGQIFYHDHIDFYASLIRLYFTRQTGDRTQIERIQVICDRLESLCSHSQWNFENKYLLIKAECHFTNGEISKAIETYEASITSSRNHKFLHEEAIGCELAGYFYKDLGDAVKSIEMLRRARHAYMKWGATQKANTLPGEHVENVPTN